MNGQGRPTIRRFESFSQTLIDYFSIKSIGDLRKFGILLLIWSAGLSFAFAQYQNPSPRSGIENSNFSAPQTTFPPSVSSDGFSQNSNAPQRIALQNSNARQIDFPQNPPASPNLGVPNSVLPNPTTFQNPSASTDFNSQNINSNVFSNALNVPLNGSPNNNIPVPQNFPRSQNIFPDGSSSNSEFSNLSSNPDGLCRINICWSSEEPQLWVGEIVLSNGRFSQSVPLGADATSPVVFHSENEGQGKISFQTTTPTLFSGVQTTIHSTKNDVLIFRLTNIQTRRSSSDSFRLDSLIAGPVQLTLNGNDAPKNVAVVDFEQIAGDELPVQIQRLNSTENGFEEAKHLIFRPGEPLKLTVSPRFFSVAAQENLSLQVLLTSNQSDSVLWTETREIDPRSPQTTPLTFQLNVPNETGVFNIDLQLQQINKQKSFSLVIPNKENKKLRQLASRTVQGVSVAASVASDSKTESYSDADFDLRNGIIETIDPSNPVWWKVFAKRSLFSNLKKNEAKTDSSKNGNEASNFSSEISNFGSGSSVFDSGATNFSFGTPNFNSETSSFGFGTSNAENEQANNKDESSNKKSGDPMFDGGVPLDSTVLGQAPASRSLFNGNGFPFKNNDKNDPNQTRTFLKGKTTNVDWLKFWNLGGVQTLPNPAKWGDWGQWEDLWKNSRGNGRLRPYQPTNGPQFESFAQLDPSFDPDVIPWESYSIPIKEPGTPHILEIEYLSHIPQTLGITILEPSITGGVFPATLDSGLVVPDDPLSDRIPNRILRYQILFWPKTKTPTVLLMNRRTDKPAVFGRIRLYRAKDQIPAFSTEQRGRSFVAMLSRPTFCDQFCALRAESSVGATGAENWKTVFDSVERMTRYLRFVGYDSLMLSSVADGSSLYPSSLLKPSPKFDSGVFLENGEDPVRKDVLELVSRVFDSERLSLIPSLDFNAPLPSLEERFRRACQNERNSNSNLTQGTPESQNFALQTDSSWQTFQAKRPETSNVAPNDSQSNPLNGSQNDWPNNSPNGSNFSERRNDSTDAISLSSNLTDRQDDRSFERTEGIYWIGPDGRFLIDRQKTESGTGPYYNILHPLVQQAMLDVIAEIVSRYGNHRSFGGLAIQLSANGFAQLPDDVYYGMDDETITRFVREANLREKLSQEKNVDIQEFLTVSGPQKYRFRAQFVKERCLDEWIAWRSQAVYQFYERVGQTIAERRPDAKLYLVGTKMLDGDLGRFRLYPTLTRQIGLKETIRQVGFDLDLFAQNSSIVFLRPGIVASTSTLNQKAPSMKWDSADSISLFSKNPNNVGTVFEHLATARNLPDFDRTSPFHPTVTQIATRAVSIDYENRRRFVNQLSVADTFYFFDGGETIPTGAEYSLREFISVFKNIPQIPFSTWTENDGGVLDSSGSEKSLQPIVVRFAKTKKETWVYLLNNAPFHTKIRLSMKYQSGTDFELLGEDRNVSEPALGVDSFVWATTIRPFGMLAFRLSDPRATFDYVDVSRPDEICGPNGRLNQEVQDFVDRILIARLGVETEMRNADFDEFPNSTTDGLNDSALDSTKKNATESARSTDGASKSLLGLEMPKMNLLKNPFDQTERPDSPTANAENLSPNPQSIPGWRRFGDARFETTLDSENSQNGQYCLKMTNSGSVGGVISQPFEPPTTGRLCVQISFGIPETEESLPLRICLTGRYNGAPYQRLLTIGPTILQRIRQARSENKIEPKNGVLWIQDVILFDRLPLDGLEDVSLRFDVLAQGTVWVDQIRLYKLAFADIEQNELMRIINTVEYRAEKKRVVDLMNLLDGYWARLLEEQIPDDSPLLANRPAKPVPNVEAVDSTKRPPEKEARNLFQRMFSWK